MAVCSLGKSICKLAERWDSEIARRALLVLLHSQMPESLRVVLERERSNLTIDSALDKMAMMEKQEDPREQRGSGAPRAASDTLGIYS